MIPILYMLKVKVDWLNTAFCCRRLTQYVDTKKKIITCTWNIRFPVRTTYTIPSDIIATHTCVCRLTIADHGNHFRCNNTMSKTFALASFIRNSVTGRFRSRFCFNTMKRFNGSCFNAINMKNQKYHERCRW